MGAFTDFLTRPSVKSVQSVAYQLSSETRLKSLSVRSRAAVYNYGQVWSLIPMARATITITIIMQVAA